jgi:hypothetical protein
MDHKSLVEAVAASMSNSKAQEPTPAEAEAERVEELREDPEMFKISIKLITGEEIVMDARKVNWDELSTPEYKYQLDVNENTIRGMVYNLMTLDFTDPKMENYPKECDDSIMEYLHNFGVDPNYDKISEHSMVKPYVLTIGKCFDVMNIIHTIQTHIEVHDIATKIFGIADSFKDVANLNDIADMNNSADNIIVEDRMAFDNIDDHDYSGLVSE